MSYDTATPYVASYVLVRQNGKIAFVLRSHTGWMNGYYGLPSGKIEKNESFLAGAVREAKEEIGITIKVEDLKPLLTMHRNVPSDPGITWVDIFFEAIKWEGEAVNAEPHKHSELAWLDPNNLPENTVDSVSFAMEQILAGNAYCEYGWTD